MGYWVSRGLGFTFPEMSSRCGTEGPEAIGDEAHPWPQPKFADVLNNCWWHRGHFKPQQNPAEVAGSLVTASNKV